MFTFHWFQWFSGFSPALSCSLLSFLLFSLLFLRVVHQRWRHFILSHSFQSRWDSHYRGFGRLRAREAQIASHDCLSPFHSPFSQQAGSAPDSRFRFRFNSVPRTACCLVCCQLLCHASASRIVLANPQADNLSHFPHLLDLEHDSSWMIRFGGMDTKKRCLAKYRIRKYDTRVLIFINQNFVSCFNIKMMTDLFVLFCL